MVLLALIGLAQLVVLVLLLLLVAQQAVQRESDRLMAGRAVRGLQQQTIRALFRTAQATDVDPYQTPGS
jgi:hypothetical protein